MGAINGILMGVYAVVKICFYHGLGIHSAIFLLFTKLTPLQTRK